MMTLERFRALAASYGADLRRWPQDEVDQARELLAGSEQARGLLEEEGVLDAAIERAERAPAGGEAAALGRLRSALAARIAEPRGWRIGWLGFVASGAVAIAAGVFVGAMYDKPPQKVTVLNLLLVDEYE